MMLAVVLLLVALGSIVVCHMLARRRGLNPVFWALMGAIFGPFAIPFVYFRARR